MQLDCILKLKGYTRLSVTRYPAKKWEYESKIQCLTKHLNENSVEAIPVRTLMRRERLQCRFVQVFITAPYERFLQRYMDVGLRALVGTKIMAYIADSTLEQMAHEIFDKGLPVKICMKDGSYSATS